MIVLLLTSLQSMSQNPDHLTVIKPKEINDVLINPGMGFMTFQRFNGDDLNAGSGWTEGYPIDYQNFDGDLTNKDHPATTIAYWRIYWKFLEPEMGKYRWDMLDKALEVARSRGQTLLLRIAPYGTGDERDVPAWYRKMVGSNKNWKFNSEVNGWMVDAEDPRYAEYFGGMIRDLGARYDGHPDLEAVDLSIVGAWGEGAGSELLSQAAREALESHPRDESPFVFPGREGRQRTRYPKGIDAIRERAGLPPDFRPLHGLRHVYASMLASSGQVDLYTLQKLLTHKSAAMTQRYAHLRDEVLRRASDLAGDLIGQALNGNKPPRAAQQRQED